MGMIKINPLSHPPGKGEPWWIISPNDGQIEFMPVIGAGTLCVRDFLKFRSGVAYRISAVNDQHGWITVETKEDIVEMPYYVFARYFDYEAFLRGIPSNGEEK